LRKREGGEKGKRDEIGGRVATAYFISLGTLILRKGERGKKRKRGKGKGRGEGGWRGLDGVKIVLMRVFWSERGRGRKRERGENDE